VSTESGWRRLRRSVIWRELQPYASLVIGLVAYGILRVVFAHVMGSNGLVTPSGAPSKALAVFGLVMLVMRLTVLVVVPLVVTYRLVCRLFALGQRRGGGARTDDDAPTQQPP
jgi:hypothetical protein